MIGKSKDSKCNQNFGIGEMIGSNYDVIHKLNESSKRIRKNKFSLKKSWKSAEMIFVSEDISQHLEGKCLGSL